MNLVGIYITGGDRSVKIYTEIVRTNVGTTGTETTRRKSGDQKDRMDGVCGAVPISLSSEDDRRGCHGNWFCS